MLERTIRRLIEEYLGDDPERLRSRVDRIEAMIARMVELQEEQVKLLKEIKKLLSKQGGRRG